MENKAQIQQVVQDYIRAQGPRFSVSKLARRVGIPQATLNRMLGTDDPSYRGDPDSWLKLARYWPLHLNAADVLAALWLTPEERAQSSEEDPLATIANALRQLHVDADEAAPIMLLVQGAAARARASRSAGSQ